MQKKMAAGMVAAATIFAGAPALAQEFGQSGDVSFAADRLMGLYLLDEVGDGVTLGLGGPPFGGFIYTMPRLGIDFFIIDGLSLGGSVVIWAGDDDRVDGDDDFGGIMFEPRVGYAINFSDSFGIWPRGGLTIWNIEDFDGMALTAEAMFYGIPGDQWGFLFGPTLDIELVGDGSEGLAFGLIAAGVFGWL
jgi:hypothetical protein